MFSIVRVPIVRCTWVRFVMGKPYTGEDLKELWEYNNANIKDKNSITIEEVEKNSPTVKRFSKSFQTYLDNLIAEDLKKIIEKK